MRFNFKKVASILASGIMLSSTVGMAVAANLYPAPFTAGTAVVYGSAAAPTDMTGAIEIYDQLKARASAAGGTDASVSGEAKAVETASQKLYFGDYMNTTKGTFTKDQLPTILADKTITDDDGKEYTVEGKVDVPTAHVIYGDTPDNLAEPVVYMDTNSANEIFSMKLVFPTSINVTKFPSEPINIFGKEYTFSGSSSQLTNNSIVLFEKATPVRIKSGESVTVEGHEISIAVEDSDTISISVDGSSSVEKDQGWSGKINNVDIYIKNVFGPSRVDTEQFADISLNANKLTLAHANEVTLGSTDIDGTNVTLTQSGELISEIKVDFIPYNYDTDIQYLVLGDSMVDPVFGAIKLELASITPDLESSARDLIKFWADGENTLSLKFTNRAGKEYNMQILKPSNIALAANYSTDATTPAGNDTFLDGGTYTYNATELGTRDNAIVSDATTNVTKNDYFITCSNDYTQIWKLKDITLSTTNTLKVEDMGAGSSSIDLTLTGATSGSTASLPLGDGNTATLTLQVGPTNAVLVSSNACSYLYTKNGAKIDLTLADAPISNTSEIVIDEETAYNGGSFTNNAAATLGAAKNITLRWRWIDADRSGKDMYIRDIFGSGSSGPYALDTDYWTDDIGDYFNNYITSYGTFIKQTGDSNDKVYEIYYPEDAAAIGFYIGEEMASITPGSTGEAGGQISIIKDSDASSVTSKHLVVVGGSCVNTVAAKILGSETPVCGADFSEKTQVSAGGYIIKTVASPYNDDKVAMLVAGYSAVDTTNAIKRAMVIDGVMTDVGSEEIFPVVA